MSFVKPADDANVKGYTACQTTGPKLKCFDLMVVLIILTFHLGRAYQEK